MTTPKLKLPELTASQSQKHVTHNEALFFLDTLVQLAVIDKDLSTPPGSPTLGATYIVGSAPTGSWTGKTNQVASYDGSGWIFFVPVEGWNAWVNDEDTAYYWDGSAWTSSGGGGGLGPAAFNDGTVTLLGINGATADATNRLSMNAPGALFNHAGAGFNMTLNKAATGNTLSQTWQTGFSTRAILGLLADNNFAIRTSADGSAFFNALTFTAGSGRATFAESLLAGNGSAAVPAFTFASDTNTGIYSLGADQLGISVGGTLRLTVSTTAITVASPVTALNATSTNISALHLGLGGATADTTNRLSINTPAVLLNNAGTSIDMTFNKNAVGNDATLSFKTGFSVRGIIGLQGDDDLTLKVSPDGSTFNTALILKAATGRAEVSQPIEMVAQSALPTNPGSGKLAIYPRNRAGQIWLDVLRPSGRDFPLQPHFGVNRIARWSPSTGTTVNSDGMPRTAVGTVSTPTLAATNLGTSMRRWTMTSAATAGAAAEDRSTGWVCWRGNAAGFGGFTYVNRLSLTTLQATGMGFFGLYGSTAALATTLTLATVVNCIGLGFQRGTHTNWQLVHNDGAGAPTLTDLGANFPINTTHVLTLFIMAAPNASAVGVRVVNETTGNSTEFTISTDMPATNQFLSPHSYMNNDATAAAVAYDCAGVYIETDV